jgi:hypothetical protein
MTEIGYMEKMLQGQLRGRGVSGTVLQDTAAIGHAKHKRSG